MDIVVLEMKVSWVESKSTTGEVVVVIGLVLES
jgi:hypothetical protein